MNSLQRLWTPREGTVVSMIYDHLDEATACHSLRVGRALMEDGYPGDVVDVGLFHDFLEDSDKDSAWLLEQGLPEYMVQAVLSLTRQQDESYDAYITRVAGAGSLVRTVKIYDIVDNLTRTDPITNNRRNKLKAKYRKALLFLAGDLH